MKICFAASGGGHLRQVLELAPLWSAGECFFISEDSVLLRTFEGPTRRLSVPPFALGELMRKGKLGFVRRILANMRQSWLHIRGERPDILITTGAGSVFFSALFARLTGAKVIVVETFSRSTSLSKFARFTGPIANIRILQTPSLARYWPDAPIFDPIKALPDEVLTKEDLIFVTVGATLPFDRMVMSMAFLKESGLVESQVVYQIGRGARRPDGEQIYEEMPSHAIKAVLKQAKIVICHGGSGSIIPALEAGCHVIAFDRRSGLQEHFDNHQKDLTRAFEARGLIQLAWDAESLRSAIEQTHSRPIKRMTSDMSALSGFLASKIAQWGQQKSDRGSA